MGKYLLASQKLTRAGQGLTDYAYFQAFLLTVQDFPAMTQSMSLYYAQYPTVSQKSLATLFPFLTEQKEFILQQSASSLFSGAATPPPGPAKTAHNPKNKGKNKGRGKGKKQYQQGRVQWGPKGPMAFSTVPAVGPLAARLPRNWKTARDDGRVYGHQPRATRIRGATGLPPSLS